MSPFEADNEDAEWESHGLERLSLQCTDSQDSVGGISVKSLPLPCGKPIYGALPRPLGLSVIQPFCNLEHHSSKQQLFMCWAFSWLLFKTQAIYYHYKCFVCNFKVEKAFFFPFIPFFERKCVCEKWMLERGCCLQCVVIQ